MDVLSFGRGMTRQLIDGYRSGSSDLLRYLVVAMPSDDGLRPLVGVGDLLILGVCFVALAAVTGRPPRAAATLLAGLAVGLVVGLSGAGTAGVPFIAGATLLELWRSSRVVR